MFSPRSPTGEIRRLNPPPTSFLHSALAFLRRHPIRTALGGVILCLFAYLTALALNWKDEFVIEDTFSKSDRIRNFMEKGDGVLMEDGRLGVAGGETAERRYLISRTTNQSLNLRIRRAANPIIDVAAFIVFEKQNTALDPVMFDGRPIDITLLTHHALSRIEIRMTSRAPGGSPPEPALESFSIERVGKPVPRDWPSFIFFWSVALFFWGTLALAVVPAIFERALGDRGNLAPDRRVFWALSILAMLLSFAWLTSNPAWKAKKDYDDRSAISNGATLLDFGYQPSMLYFRSRVRPAFPAIVQPILTLRPHRLSEYWLNPSDFKARVWFIHDQDNWSFGTSTYPILSFTSLGVALVMLGLAYALYREAGVSGSAALVATLLFAIFYRRALAIPITQTLNLFVNLVAVWAWLRWGSRDAFFVRCFAGLFLGLAIIEKETAGTTAAAIGLFILVDGPIRSIPSRLLASLPFWLGAAVLPVWYFGGVSEGGFGELFSNFDQHLSQQELNQFEPLSLASGVRDLWTVFSAGLPLALLAIAAGAVGRFRSRAEKLFLCWAIGCLPVFSLPYIFPRFLQFFIPAFAFWIATLADRSRRVLAPVPPAE